MKRPQPRRPLPASFVCPTCQLRSYHPKDVEQRFCARCGFADDNAERARAAEQQPRPQELPPCHRHPDKECPGEC